MKKQRPSPQKLFLRFFRWFCDPTVQDYIEGDLMEAYTRRLKSVGKRKADLKFIVDVVMLCRPGLIRSINLPKPLNNMAMLTSYFKLSLRQLAKYKSFTAINVFGLVTGFLCFILIALYIQDELSFDKFHTDADRTYRIIQHKNLENGELRNIAETSGAIGKEAVEQFPEVTDFCRLFSLGRITVGNDPANRNYQPLLSADANFFTFFNFPLIEGQPDQVLKNPDNVVLSETLAKLYFGNEPAVGKRLWTSLYRDGAPVECLVTGVMKDFPANSHLQIEILFSEATWLTYFNWYKNVPGDWTSNFFVNYIKVSDETSPIVLSAKLDELLQPHLPEGEPVNSNFSLQPISKIHLHSADLESSETSNKESGVNPFYIYMFSVVGILLLLIAFINYTNMSTTLAIKRTQEMGIRKSLGARQGSMIAQFTIDSLLLSFVSFAIAVLLAHLLIPMINEFTGKQLEFSTLPMKWILLIVACIFLSAIVSSIYPAYTCLRASMVNTMKGGSSQPGQLFSIRKILLVVQFTISIAMIASTFVIYDQLQYLRNKDIGYDVDRLMVIDINSGALRRNVEGIKAEFSKIPEVLNVSTTTRVPGEWKTFAIAEVNEEGNDNGDEMIYMGADQDFLDTYDIQLKKGRNFEVGPADSLKVMLTELAVKQLGLNDPVGQMIEIPRVRWGGHVDELNNVFRAEVIGVVEDFHFESLKNEMKPVVIGSPNTVIQRIDYYTLKVRTSDWGTTLEKLKAVNQQFDQDNPLEYTFLNDRFEEFYQADVKRGQLFLVFSGIVIIIACLGLFALVTFTVESRTKEIGVRKVLGASIRSIVGLVSKEFIVLLFISLIIGLPLAWYLMRNWLQDFAYKVSLSAGVFITAGGMVMLVALVAISFRAIQAAKENPVNALRSE